MRFGLKDAEKTCLARIAFARSPGINHRNRTAWIIKLGGRITAIVLPRDEQEDHGVLEANARPRDLERGRNNENDPPLIAGSFPGCLRIRSHQPYADGDFFAGRVHADGAPSYPISGGEYRAVRCAANNTQSAGVDHLPDMYIDHVSGKYAAHNINTDPPI
jgi:hypothetical protein